jgi:hypothetical protein
MSTFYWRAWIGPRFTPASNSRSYDWSGIDAGATFTPASDKTVTTNVTSGATSVILNSVTNLAPKGGGFLGPNGAGQSWEYIEYTSISTLTLSTVAREDTTVREHNGVHTAGAVFRQWWPLTMNDGRIHLVRKMNDELSALTWEMEISGVMIPRFALKNEHIIVIESKTDGDGAWTVYAVGWLTQPEMIDDSSYTGEWKARVKSIAGVLNSTMLRGVRVGRLDVAKVASAKTNSQLTMAWKERHSGDFIEADPVFEPENVMDSDTGTLWISERVVGTDYVEVNDSTLGYLEDGNFATQLHLRNPPNGEKGYRWIEWMGEPSDLNNLFYNGYITTSTGNQSPIAFGHPNVTFPDRHVICEDEERFLEANPLGGGTANICEIPSWWWDLIDLENDAIAIYYVRPIEGNFWSKTIAWGTDGLTASKTPILDYEGDDLEGDTWPGTQIQPPGPPERMIRFVYDADAVSPSTQPAQHYVIGYVDHVGYRIQMGEMEDWERPWVILRLPGLGLMLRDTITDSEPGASDALYIVDGGGPSVGGLPSSGTISIGDERISYSAKDESTGALTVTARGASSTTAASHRSGDIIEVVDTDGVVTDGMPVEYLGWTRYGGSSNPTAFKIMTSNRENVRSPIQDDDSWLADWSLIGDITGYGGGAAYGTGAIDPVRRVRHLLIEVYGMSGNPSRARVNEIYAELDNSLYPADEWMDLPSPFEDVLERLLENAGVPSGAIDLSDVTSVDLVRPMNTAFESAWKVIEDAASYLGLRLEVGLDSKINVVNNEFWTETTHTPSHTWDRENASRVEVFWERARPNSEVTLNWLGLDDDSIQGVVRYPTSGAYWMGEPVEVGPYLHLTETDASTSAQRRFWMARFPYRFLVQTADGDEDAYPGRIELVDWQVALDDDLRASTDNQGPIRCLAQICLRWMK